uniref:Outer membrane lipoprotein carrier protein LolA n=1 Tax=candidate division WOR-3 bacterium TaxID=2052148 RepID=A0A7V3ZXW3_UNCW3
MLFLLILFLYPDTLISFDFFHILKDNQRTDSSWGKIFSGDYLVYISVEKPIKQVIYFSGDTMTVNYPDSKRAFMIKSGITFNLQGPGGIFGKVGYNLKKSGFMFLKREVNGIQKIETWVHPKTKLKIIYTLEGERIIGVTSLSEKGDTLINVTYADYQRVKDKDLPMTLKISTPDYEEIYKLSNPTLVPFNDSLRSYLEVGKDTKIEYKGFEK